MPLLQRAAAGFKEMGEPAELLCLEVAELAAVEGADGLIEAGEKAEPFGGDAGEDAAAVGMLAAAGDQPAFFEAIEQAGDIGVAGDHAGGDFPAQQAFGSAAQDTERVVLGRGKAMLAEKLRGTPREPVGGALDFDEKHFLGAGGAGRAGLGAVAHIRKDGGCNR